MITVAEILEQIESTQGLNAKQALLASHSDNLLLKKIFQLTSDAYVNFYVAKVPKRKQQPGFCASSDRNFEELFDVLEKCMSREITGNTARDTLGVVLSKMNDFDFKWASRIITRKLRTGIGDSGIEKTWPGLLPKFEPALAKEVEWHLDDQEKLQIDTQFSYPVIVEPKWDGFRCIAVKNGTVTMYARSGRVFDRAPAIKAWLEKYMVDGWVADGELIASRWEDTASIIGSRVNYKDDETLTYQVFDCLPLYEWKEQRQGDKFSNRCHNIANKVVTAQDGPVKRAQGKYVMNVTELVEYYETCLTQGHEGIMVKDTNAAYAFKRSTNLMKLKPLTSWDGVVTAVLPGKEGTKWAGMMTILQVRLPGGSTTRVGTGFSDEERVHLDIERDNLVGMPCEVQGQPPLTDEGCIRFPRFMRWREEWDCSPEVRELIKEVKEQS